MSAFAILLRRDLAILLPGGARGSALLPLIFCLLVAVLFNNYIRRRATTAR